MIKDDIQKNILVALKEKKQTELKALRFILSEIKYAEIDKQKELTDDEIKVLLAKEVKKRNDAIELFRQNNRDDLVSDEVAQVEIIRNFLPKEMSEEELDKAVDEALAEITDRSNVGKVIGLVMGKLKGKADGGKISGLVKSKLQSS